MENTPPPDSSLLKKLNTCDGKKGKRHYMKTNHLPLREQNSCHTARKYLPFTKKEEEAKKKRKAKIKRLQRAIDGSDNPGQIDINDDGQAEDMCAACVSYLNHKRCETCMSVEEHITRGTFKGEIRRRLVEKREHPCGYYDEVGCPVCSTHLENFVLS